MTEDQGPGDKFLVFSFLEIIPFARKPLIYAIPFKFSVAEGSGLQFQSIVCQGASRLVFSLNLYRKVQTHLWFHRPHPNSFAATRVERGDHGTTPDPPTSPTFCDGPKSWKRGALTPHIQRLYYNFLINVNGTIFWLSE